VLVVDDDPDGRDLLNSVLAYCGALVTLVPSARAGLAATRTIAPDVIVVAVDLAGEDGFWLVRELRGSSGSVAIPVIAVADDREGGPERTLTAGFDAYLRKPVDPWDLCRIVAEVARKP